MTGEDDTPATGEGGGIMEDVPRTHQLRIARRTLELSDEGAAILGGMTKDEARRLLAEERDRRRARG